MIAFPPPASLAVVARRCVLAALLLDLISGCGDGVGRPILRASSGSVGPAAAGMGASGTPNSSTASGVVVAAGGAATTTVSLSGGGSPTAASSVGSGGLPTTLSATGRGGLSTALPGTGIGGAAAIITLVATGGVTASSQTLATGGQQPSCGSTELRADEATSNEDNLASLINLVRELGVSCLANGTSDAAPSLSMSESLRCAARLHSQSGYAKGGAAQISRDTGIPESQIAEIEVTTDKTQNAENVIVDLVVDERRCPPLADAQYQEIGVGFASDRDSKYWTILLTR